MKNWNNIENWNNKELQQVLAEVAHKSAIDSEFRALALRDASSALSTITPKRLPKDITLIFVDNSGSTKTIPLPDLVITDCDELTDDDLENVAGGSTPPPPPPLTGG
jgi:hypothetical protein